jgi:DAK2 domain fusion protein YloV
VSAEKTSQTTERSPQLTIDGQNFKHLTNSALNWLRHHQATINTLNVYPVPDGDTGTNMVLTMQSAWAEIAESSERSVGIVAHQMAHGALMGARGNSGVILSQIWRGFARSLDEKATCGAQDLAAAWREATATAYKGVVKPVEGTILTVVRAIADEITKAAEDTDDLVHLLERGVFAGHEAVLLTPSLLPVLAEAGVVDAGGQGLFVILEGMLRHMRGEPISEEVAMTESVGPALEGLAPGEAGYGYDVQFLVVGEGLDVDAIRQEITGMGECPLVVGEPTTVKVHVHVLDPGVPISYGAGLGSLRDVVVEDMQAQYQDLRGGVAESGDAPPQEIGVVAVVVGDGLSRVFESLGVDVIVPGGQTMNPSTQDLLEAIEHLPAERVILLPNNSNVIMAAEQANELSSKPVAVVPSRFIPQGIAAMLAYNPQNDYDACVEAMMAAMQQVETGEITCATRTATINGFDIAEGQIIGLHDGDVAAAGATASEVVQELLKQMSTEECEIITLYFGQDVTEKDATALADKLQDTWPDHEVEVVAGGQPHYHYILSAE